MKCLGVFLLAAGLSLSVQEDSSNEILVEGGVYLPFFRDKNEKDQAVAALWVDKYPVTNRDFLIFVKCFVVFFLYYN